MRVKTKARILRGLFIVIGVIYLPLALVSVPFQLLLAILQKKYSELINRVHADRRKFTEDDIVYAQKLCKCSLCTTELNYAAIQKEKGSKGENAKNKICKFCHQSCQKDKYGNYYCPNCG